MEKNFNLMYKISFENDSFLELQKFCTDLMSKEPEKIFKSIDFVSISEKSLVTLIQNDNLPISDVQVWGYVLKWGLAQNPELSSDPSDYSKNDFNNLKNTLQQCIPFIKFYNLTPKEFSDKVLPYKKVLPKELYKELLKYFLDHDSKPNDKSKSKGTREIKSEPQITKKTKEIGLTNIDSKLITNENAAYIASWIDKKDTKIPYIPYGTFDNPYRFKLLLRGSRDGSDAKTFHKLCDNKSKTVTIVKVKGTNEILGGYNPLIWESTENKSYSKTSDSFIFSFTFMSLKDVVLSRVKDYECAIFSHVELGPYFGEDFAIINKNIYRGTSRTKYYEKNIRFTNNFFDIEEYEVFQIFDSRLIK